MSVNKEKQIGGPGYVGSFIVVMHGQEKLAMWEANVDNVDLNAIAYGYRKGAKAFAYKKADPFVSAELVGTGENY